MTGGPDGLTPKLREVAAAVLPGVGLAGATVAGGQSHTVVVLPGRAVVRVARTAAEAAELPCRTELLRRLAGAGLPFAVPEPLAGPVTTAGCTAVALSWVPGAAHPAGSGDPARLAALLGALREVDPAPLTDVLAVPHTYAGGQEWAELMTGAVIDRLPASHRTGARERVEAVLGLPPVPPALVHGDLAGHNVHWDDRGRVCGVLDWDVASAWDPAVDAACLAGWHGRPAVRAAVGPATYERARLHQRVFGLEQIAFHLLSGAAEPQIAACVRRTLARLDREAAERD